MIELQTLSKTYRTGGRVVDALDKVSAHLPKSITALIGDNGSGKSTLIRILCTLETADSGSFAVDGVRIDGKARIAYREQIGYVPQDVRFVSTMSCKDALAYAGWVAGLSRSEYLARIPEVLDEVGLSQVADARVGSLSGGQNRRIGIAAALMHHPHILYFDEPTAGLDPQARFEVRNLIRSVGERATVVISTHLTDDVNSLADHVVALNRGCVTYEGGWRQLQQAATSAGSLAHSSDALEAALAYLSASAAAGEATP